MIPEAETRSLAAAQGVELMTVDLDYALGWSAVPQLSIHILNSHPAANAPTALAPPATAAAFSAALAAGCGSSPR